MLDLWLWSLLQPLKGIIGSLVMAGINIEEMLVTLKALLCTNVLNDVTAAPFSVSFLQLVAEKKTPKMVQL